MCTTLYCTQTFSIVLKRTNGNVYDPVSYSNFQYRTEPDQWKCVRPCIVLKLSVSYWNGPMGMCTTLYRTKSFSIVLNRTNENVYDPVSYSNFQYRTETDQWKSVRPCIVLKLSVSYWNWPMGMCTTLYRTKPFSIVLKRTNGNVYDPVSYSNFQYRTETDQWKCVRPCIVLNHSVSFWNWPMGMCTTLYRTQTFCIVLKRTNGNVYDPVSYSNF